MKTESAIEFGNMEIIDDIDKSDLDREGGTKAWGREFKRKQKRGWIKWT